MWCRGAVYISASCALMYRFTEQSIHTLGSGFTCENGLCLNFAFGLSSPWSGYARHRNA